MFIIGVKIRRLVRRLDLERTVGRRAPHSNNLSYHRLTPCTAISAVCDLGGYRPAHGGIQPVREITQGGSGGGIMNFAGSTFTLHDCP
jgi:hypothetical protein